MTTQAQFHMEKLLRKQTETPFSKNTSRCSIALLRYVCLVKLLFHGIDLGHGLVFLAVISSSNRKVSTNVPEIFEAQLTQSIEF